jgi:aerobic-type carbon monoxide dehydrogenase small subunit (CoxS/CutS family)
LNILLEPNGRLMITLHVNGSAVELDIDAEKPLIWLLREDLGLTGTKYCCGAGDCGVCTVHVDGEAAPACRIPAREAAGHRIVTIEGLASEQPDHPVLRVWEAEAIPQCGYCQPGQVMTAAALFAATPAPMAAELEQAMDRVLCRCGTYARIRRAIRQLMEAPSR